MLICKRTVTLANSKVNKEGVLDKITRDHIQVDLENLTNWIDFGIDNMRRDWAAFSSAYHKTIHSLRENGCPFPEN